MADIFFSYTRNDKQRVEPIITALEAQGWTVWWDPHLVGGGSWNDEIEAELKKARCAIVAWSSQSAKSNFVREEAGVARDAHKLIPLLLEPMKPPFGFGGLQSLDFSGWDGSSEADEFTRLCNAVRAKLGVETPPPPTPPPQPPRWRAATIGLTAAGIAALFLWFLYDRQPPPYVPDPIQATAAEWPKNPPDQAYCFQRRNSSVVTPGKFLVRCFLTYELCEEVRPGDLGEKTDCRFVTGLRWTDAKKDQRTPPTWHQYSNSVIPPPFPGF